MQRKGTDAAGTHVLVVANRTAATATLLDEVERRAKDTMCRFALLIPDVADRKAADWTLDAALPLLERAAGGPVEGLVGGPDALESIQQAVEEHRFDEIVISTLPKRSSKWLGNDLPPRRAARGFLSRWSLPSRSACATTRDQQARSASPGVA